MKEEKFYCDMCRRFNEGKPNMAITGINSFHLPASKLNSYVLCYDCAWKIIPIVHQIFDKSLKGMWSPEENEGSTMATETWGGAGPDCIPAPG